MSGENASSVPARGAAHKADRFLVPQGLENRGGLNKDSYHKMYAASCADPEKFWAEQAGRLQWIRRWDKVLDYDYSRAHIRWFEGGTLNVCFNCVDRHALSHPDKTALIWEANEPGESIHISYAALKAEVCRIANVLKNLGVKKGDRIALYLPMIPELAFSMLACARIGAIHSVIFGGFSAEAVRDRVLDSQACVVITANEGLRGSKTIPLKAIVDEALQRVSCVRQVLVAKRTAQSVPMQEGRDIFLDEARAGAATECPCEEMGAEDPLFILYTSGSTGKPKGVLHTQAGYLLYAAFTHELVFDCRENDIYFCAADIGWITGHSYVVYGPLANGATSVMFESIPTYPDAGRYWDVIDRHRVTIFYTAPTAIRAVAKEGDALVDNYALDSLRVLGSVGEPINEAAWLWYHERIGKKRCMLVDTWWQTETGGILISPIAGITETKPGSATLPLFGVQPCVLDADGKELQGNDVTGRLGLKFPWPGQMRTVWGDQQRFFDTYFSQYRGYYFTGDACHRDADGYYWITGRVDDVLNVAGHRLGSAELESAIVGSGLVAEAAVVATPHEVKGQGIYAFCILKESVAADEATRTAVREAVRKSIGGFAAPDVIQFVPGLPKTRSGKIMRRILRKIAEGEREEFGDITTLADPGVVAAIVQNAASRI